MKKTRISAGFTFIEILLSMVFFMVIIASFAMVFPSGYHLNLKTYRQNSSVNLADAILQEVASKPFYALPGDAALGDSLQNLQGWGCLSGCANAWTPQALTAFAQNNPTLYSKYGYSLPPSTSATPGIQVTCVEANCFPIVPSPSDDPLVQVTVHLIWRDNSNGAAVPRLITLTTYATANR